MSDLDLKRCELAPMGCTWLEPGVFLLLCLLKAVWVTACPSQPVVRTDYSAARERMVEELASPGRGITNSLVLNAMNTVPRHQFVPESLRQFAPTVSVLTSLLQRPQRSALILPRRVSRRWPSAPRFSG